MRPLSFRTPPRLLLTSLVLLLTGASAHAQKTQVIPKPIPTLRGTIAPVPPPPPPPPPKNMNVAPAPPPPPSSAIDVGTGVADITGPAAEVVMMGYANGEQVAGGISQRLYARAYVFASGGKRVVFVSAELGQLFSSIKQGVIKKLTAKYGSLYDDRNVQISATHTHAGPGGYSHHAMFNLTSFGFVPQNYNVIVEGITNAISQAHDSVGPGTVRLGTADLPNASVNRSIAAYNKNKDLDASARTTNPTMTVMRIDRPSGPAGAISWFSVHNTSLGKNNKLISSDHKGYAAHLFEKSQGTIQPFQNPRKFVAAFPNGDEGDQSPNINPGFRGPNDPDEFKSMRTIAERELAVALSVFNRPSLDVRGAVDFRHTWVKMPGFLVVTNESNGGIQKTLCSAAYGMSFAAGAEDGPSGMAPLFTEGMLAGQKNTSDVNGLFNNFKANRVPQHLRDRMKVSPADQCHNPKPVLVPSGAWGWVAEVLPFQLLRVGNVVIAGVPGEMTVRAGSRLRKTLLDSLAPRGVNHVILTGLANEYSGYITTAEEYDTQQYEGASTLFGRLTFEAYQQIFSRLAAEMNGGVNSITEPPPPDLGGSQVSLQTGVILDNTPIGQTFGQVTQQPPAFVMQNGVVDVTFRAGHPKNDLMTGSSYYFIQRLTPGGAWADAVWDSMPEGRFAWKRDADLLCKGCSTVSVHWDVPSDAIPGTYRIKHVGARKDGGTGAISRYEGLTQNFEVRAPGSAGAVTPCGGVGQRGCCVSERQGGLTGAPCTGNLRESGTCTSGCTCGGNNPGGATKSLGMCVAPAAEAVIAPCGAPNQRACCASERLGGIAGSACSKGTYEKPGCVGNCTCGNNPARENSSGMCIAPTPCGGAGQRACCAGERAGGVFGAPCQGQLKERGPCTGDCTCGGDNAAGTFRSGGMCR